MNSGVIDKEYLLRLIGKSEGMVKKKIRYLVYSCKEFKDEYGDELNGEEMLLLWKE